MLGVKFENSEAQLMQEDGETRILYIQGFAIAKNGPRSLGLLVEETISCHFSVLEREQQTRIVSVATGIIGGHFPNGLSLFIAEITVNFKRVICTDEKLGVLVFQLRSRDLEKDAKAALVRKDIDAFYGIENKKKRVAGHLEACRLCSWKSKINGLKSFKLVRPLSESIRFLPKGRIDSSFLPLLRVSAPSPLKTSPD